MICLSGTVNVISLQTNVNIPYLTHPFMFCIHITNILVSHVHKNTVMNDELILILQSSLRFLPTWLPIILLRRVEEQFPGLSETCCLPVCRQNIVSSYSGDLYGPEYKGRGRIIMLSFAFSSFYFVDGFWSLQGLMYFAVLVTLA